MKKPKLLFPFIALALIILVILGVLYYPFIDFKSHVKDNPKEQELVLTNYLNPFKPKVSEILALKEGGYWVTVVDYERTGLFEFKRGNTVNGTRKPTDLSQINAKIENKSIDEVKKIAQSQDLSIQEYAPDKSQAEKEYDKEQEKLPECQKLVEFPNMNRQVRDFDKLYKNITIQEYIKIIPDKGHAYQKKDSLEFDVRIDDNDEKNIIKMRLIFNGSEEYKKDSDNYTKNNLIKLVKISSDCTIEEIPLK